mmetsp:Transcript_122025/g.390182  ORF Transcript_122025/g.390182 Transcript_122025/m.390182 type:complete len:159 (+) Transcript_122025:782-1258(+)
MPRTQADSFQNDFLQRLLSMLASIGGPRSFTTPGEIAGGEGSVLPELGGPRFGKKAPSMKVCAFASRACVNLRVWCSWPLGSDLRQLGGRAAPLDRRPWGPSRAVLLLQNLPSGLRIAPSRTCGHERVLGHVHVALWNLSSLYRCLPIPSRLPSWLRT